MSGQGSAQVHEKRMRKETLLHSVVCWLPDVLLAMTAGAELDVDQLALHLGITSSIMMVTTHMYLYSIFYMCVVQIGIKKLTFLSPKHK
jgi:hypothetical protein